MNRINILDCTLRDGGYINDFTFGESVIKNIIQKLSKASIDIIECGFLKSGAFDKDYSLFGSVEAVKEVIGKKNPKILYVAMIQYGAISIEEIADYDGTSIDGIRVTFHEHEIEPAFILGQQLMDKGYKVFMQPVGTTTYTDEALLGLIKRINELRPFAFYMVDTLGIMYKNDLLRMFYLVDHNLNPNIVVGFHSHNNLQLSFANAQDLMQFNTNRCIVVDASVYGMGRGAGNLHTELVTQYINSNLGLRYDNTEILSIIDEYIKPLSIQYEWGYDAAYYIASVVGCHPNYASYLLNRQTLHVQDIYAILKSLDSEQKALFDKKYIEEIYSEFMNHFVDDFDAIVKIRTFIGNKKVLLLAPGQSLKYRTEDINALISSDDYYVISINFIPKDIKVDMMFISNMKRFSGIDVLEKYIDDGIKIVATSNIISRGNSSLVVVNYASYTNEEEIISDNAGLMCINLLNKLDVPKILLAGFDGFSANLKKNYFAANMYLDVESERLMLMNQAIANKLAQLNKQIKIEFFTNSLYDLDYREDL